MRSREEIAEIILVCFALFVAYSLHKNTLSIICGGSYGAYFVFETEKQEDKI